MDNKSVHQLNSHVISRTCIIYLHTHTKNEKIPDLLFIDGVKVGPTALDGLREFLHFNRIATAAQQTTKSTKADKEMTMIIRGLIF